MPIKNQRTSKAMEKKLYGGRDNTTMLYLGPAQASYVTPRKKVVIPGVPNHSDDSTVDFLMSTHRDKGREKQRQAIQNNEEFQKLQQMKLEKANAERLRIEQNRWLQEIYDGRGLKVQQEPYCPSQSAPERDLPDNFANLLGRPGGGAPMRTNSGNLATKLRTDPTLRSTAMNNGKTAGVETDRLRKLEKFTNGVDCSFSGPEDALTARLGMKPVVYDPWGKGSGNPQRDSAGNTRGMKRADPARGIYVPSAVQPSTVLGTEYKYGGGGGQPIRGPDGEIRATRVSHFVKDASGMDQIRDNPMTKHGDPFGDGNYGNGELHRGTTFNSFTDVTATPGDWQGKLVLEKQAMERKERMANEQRVKQILGQ